MNFLAHACLSPAAAESPGILVGNLAADFIKGRLRHDLPPDLRAGVELHRRIDGFTDYHPLVLRSAALLEDRWGRYATVLVDVFFDHILATEWHHHGSGPLGEFITGVYRALETHAAQLPERARIATAAMRLQNWLGSYASLEGIELALARMSARLRHGMALDESLPDLQHHDSALREAFAQFFPQLKDHLATHAEGGATGLRP